MGGGDGGGLRDEINLSTTLLIFKLKFEVKDMSGDWRLNINGVSHIFNNSI